MPIVRLLEALGAVEHRLEAALEPVGLSLAKLNALTQLVTAGESLPLSTLADRCACVRSNITQLMDRLESDRLVARSHDAQDRRSVRAELTALGRARQAEGMALLEREEKALLGLLKPQQQKDLLDNLAVLRDAC